MKSLSTAVKTTVTLSFLLFGIYLLYSALSSTSCSNRECLGTPLLYLVTAPFAILIGGLIMRDAIWDMKKNQFESESDRITTSILRFISIVSFLLWVIPAILLIVTFP
jgi:hypothetical protein